MMSTVELKVYNRELPSYEWKWAITTRATRVTTNPSNNNMEGV